MSSLTVEEYAQDLIHRYEEMRSSVSEEQLRQYFSGHKKSIPHWLDEKTRSKVTRSFELAEAKLFPNE